MRLRPQPWHDVAREMRAAGATYERISEVVDRHVHTVARVLNPSTAEKQSATWARCYRDRYHRDPAFRAKELERHRQRRAAHREAHHAS